MAPTIVLVSSAVRNKRPSVAEAHSEPCQTFKMERLSKTANDSKSSIIFSKSSTLDVWQRSEYAF